ncbi:FAD-dependent oxidoreductase [Amycolatopsis sp. PS_44_ISF1]|uniref:FAD-dependent oxidoreductase n=1 Tax=Amycolatopsis sp. PS_44_ISF1 TaxID=2974917 RepID=UPI0028DD5D1C|nr:FAD-dependent oxidoreductase [Amycolatopsis sp. PS_44_ISF1]MDT8912576.1 FAD-dependent monooxygenase [Amycolatopsis sp. PS_44_ISF1]
MNQLSNGGRMRVLIVGGGVAGQAAAFWLRRAGHEIVVIERHPGLRASGAQVDLRGQGIEAVERMGLLPAVRAIKVAEPGVAFVDHKGVRWGKVMANTSGQGAQTMTSEYELMRGDLVRVLRDAVDDGVDYRYGVTVARIEQDETAAVVTFSDDRVEAFDLVIGADGQGSRTRSLVLGADTPELCRPIGIHMAYWFVPRLPADDDIRDSYLAGNRRMIMRRSHNATDTQVYFSMWDESAEAAAIHRKSTEEQKRFWADRYRGAGWQADRFLDGLGDTEFFYSQQVVQVRAERWSRGRVVLLGDAGYCPSPYSGMGTSLALVGAHVLAHSLASHPGDLGTALQHYETTLRPFVEHVQDAVNPKLLRFGFPQGRSGVYAMLTVARVLSTLRLPEIAARFARSDRGGQWQLPEMAATGSPVA